MTFSPDNVLIIIRDRKAALLHILSPKAVKLGSCFSLLCYTGWPRWLTRFLCPKLQPLPGLCIRHQRSSSFPCCHRNRGWCSLPAWCSDTLLLVNHNRDFKSKKNNHPLLWVLAKYRLYRPSRRTALAARNGRCLQHSGGTDAFLAPFAGTLSIIYLHTHIYTQTCLVRVVTIEICIQGGKDYALKWTEHGCSNCKDWLSMKLWENVPHSWLILLYDWSFYWHSLSSDTSLNFHTGHSLDQLIDLSSVFG